MKTFTSVKGKDFWWPIRLLTVVVSMSLVVDSSPVDIMSSYEPVSARSYCPSPNFSQEAITPYLISGSGLTRLIEGRIRHSFWSLFEIRAWNTPEGLSLPGHMMMADDSPSSGTQPSNSWRAGNIVLNDNTLEGVRVWLEQNMEEAKANGITGIVISEAYGDDIGEAQYFSQVNVPEAVFNSLTILYQHFRREQKFNVHVSIDYGQGNQIVIWPEVPGMLGAFMFLGNLHWSFVIPMAVVFLITFITLRYLSEWWKKRSAKTNSSEPPAIPEQKAPEFSLKDNLRAQASHQTDGYREPPGNIKIFLEKYFPIARMAQQMAPDEWYLSVIGAGLLWDVEKETLSDPKFSRVELVDMDGKAMKAGLEHKGLFDERYQLNVEDASLLTDDFYIAINHIFRENNYWDSARPALLDLLRDHYFYLRGHFDVLYRSSNAVWNGMSGLAISPMVLRSLWRDLFEAIGEGADEKYGVNVWTDLDIRVAFHKFSLEMERKHFEWLTHIVRPDGIILVLSDIGFLNPDMLDAVTGGQIIPEEFARALSKAVLFEVQTGRWELEKKYRDLIEQEPEFLKRSTSRSFDMPMMPAVFRQDIPFLAQLATQTGMEIIRNELMLLTTSQGISLMDVLIARLPQQLFHASPTQLQLPFDKRMDSAA